VQYDRLRDGRGKAPGLLGWWPEMAVTFVDNHDTGSSQAVRLAAPAVGLLRCRRLLTPPKGATLCSWLIPRELTLCLWLPHTCSTGPSHATR
jgi:hypothetical protein